MEIELEGARETAMKTYDIHTPIPENDRALFPIRSRMRISE